VSELARCLSDDPHERSLQFAVFERYAARTHALETKLSSSNPITRARLALETEHKHQIEGMNPRHHSALSGLLEKLKDARDRRDWQALDPSLDALDEWAKARAASTSDTEDAEDTTEEESKTPRRSRGNQYVVEHPEGDAPSSYEQHVARTEGLEQLMARLEHQTQIGRLRSLGWTT